VYRIDETDYGYRVTLEGFLQRDDAAALLGETRRRVRPRADGFALLLDLRGARAFPAEAQEVLKQVILHCRGAGMERNAVLLNSAIAALQTRRLARETGIDRWIRYIDVSSEPEWERAAAGWLERAIEPVQRGRSERAAEAARIDGLRDGRDGSGGIWSGREDLNLRPHGPEPCALPS
jgi:hypothetical protein